AAAGCDKLFCSLDQGQDYVISVRGQPDPPRIAVIDKDGSLLDLRVHRSRNPAYVIAVAYGKKRKHADQCMLDGVNSTHEIEARFPDFGFEHGFNFDPEADRLEGLRWKVEGVFRNKSVREKPPNLIGRYILGNPQPAHPDDEVPGGFGGQPLKYLGFFVADSARKKGNVHRGHMDQLFFEIERFDRIGFSPVQVDCPGMAFLERSNAFVFTKCRGLSVAGRGDRI